MTNLLLTFEVIFPLTALMIFGYFLNRIGLLDDQISQKLNTLIFKVFLPLMLYINIIDSNFKDSFNFSLVFYAVVVVLSSVCILSLLIPRIQKDHRKIGVMIQGIFRSNFVIFGTMIVQSIYSNNEVGFVAMVVAVIIPLYNALAVVILEHYRNKAIKLGSLIKQILRNPLIIASFLGLITVLFQIEFPIFIYKPLSDLAKMATPLALLVLGSTFKYQAMGKNKREIIFCTLMKLVVLPAIYLPIAVFLGFKGVDLIILVAMLGAPVAVSSYSMAKMSEADDELAGQLVVSTTAFSLISMFVILLIIRSLNLI